MKDGANGIAGNLNSAGDSADERPADRRRAEQAAAAASAASPVDIAGAGHSLEHARRRWLAWLLALAVAAPPILAVAMPWLLLRVRFFRRKWMAVTLAATPAGEQLLALRALANRPLAKLAAVSVDPGRRVATRGSPSPISGLATLELRSAGVARRTPART